MPTQSITISQETLMSNPVHPFLASLSLRAGGSASESTGKQVSLVHPFMRILQEQKRVDLTSKEMCKLFDGWLQTNPSPKHLLEIVEMLTGLEAVRPMDSN